VPEPAVLAQPDTEVRAPAHISEDQVSGSDTVLGTHRLKLRHVLQSRDVAPHIHESRREAAAWLAHLRTSQA
jgi:hypothetical protein